MIKLDNKKKLGQQITNEQIKNWITNKERIILDCGTSAGKTTLLLKNICKKNPQLNVLYLCSRNELKNEVIELAEGKVITNITIKNYQKIAHMYQHNELDNLNHYDVVFCDEVHFFSSEATFNDTVDYAWNVIDNTNNTIIYASATADSLYKYLKNTGRVKENNHYYMDRDYSYIKSITGYTKENKIPTDKLLVKKLLEETKDKIVYFVSDIDTGLELYDEFSKRYNVGFKCSNNAKPKRAVKISNKCGKVTDDKGKMKYRLLITTSALDVGINIIDKKLKHMIISTPIVSTFIQELGRARKPSNDYELNVYFEILNYSRLRGYRKKSQEQLDKITMFLNDRIKYEETYGKDKTDSYVYHNEREKDLVLNTVGYINICDLRDYYKFLICSKTDEDNIEKVSLSSVFMDALGFDSLTKYHNLKGEELLPITEKENLDREKKLKRFIRENKGKELKQNKRDTLIRLCNVKGSKGQRLSKYSSIKSYLDEIYNLNLIKKSIWDKKTKNSIEVWIIQDKPKQKNNTKK